MTESVGPRKKQPILYDDHLDPTKTELYYFIDTRLGKHTCMAGCEFCWLKRDHLREHKQDIEEARTVISQLKEQGYIVVPLLPEGVGLACARV